MSQRYATAAGRGSSEWAPAPAVIVSEGAPRGPSLICLLTNCRREDNRHGMGDSWPRFQVQTKLLSISGDSWIQNDRGGAVLKVDRGAFQLRQTFVLEDVRGAELLTIEAKLMSAHPTMKILRGGQLYATTRAESAGDHASRFRSKAARFTKPRANARASSTTLRADRRPSQQSPANGSRFARLTGWLLRPGRTWC